MVVLVETRNGSMEVNLCLKCWLFVLFDLRLAVSQGKDELQRVSIFL